jgi:tight adherence protein B
VTLTVMVFVGIAVVTFAVMMLLTRPTKAERAFQVRVAGVQRPNRPAAAAAGGQQGYLKNSSLSQFIWLDRLLQRIGAAHQLALLLAQAESPWNVSSVLISSAVLGLMGFAIARYWISDSLPALIAGVAATVVPVLVLRLKRNRRMNQFDQNLPEALDLMSRSLRAGHSMSAAIEIVAEEGMEPLRSEFARVHQQQVLGLPNRDALLQLGRRVPSTDLQVVITAMLVQKETGGNLVEILERGRAARSPANPGGRAHSHRPGTPDRSHPLPASGGHVRTDQPGQPRLYQGTHRRSGGQEDDVCGDWHDLGWRAADSKNREDQSVKL